MLKGLSSWFTPASKWVVIPGMTGQDYGGYYHGWSIPAHLPETSQELATVSRNSETCERTSEQMGRTLASGKLT
jgi:hypothetical protein